MDQKRERRTRTECVEIMAKHGLEREWRTVGNVADASDVATLEELAELLEPSGNRVINRIRSRIRAVALARSIGPRKAAS